jgi:hypothetical protein
MSGKAPFAFNKRFCGTDQKKKDLHFISQLTPEDVALLEHIGSRLLQARREYPSFADDFDTACRYIESEYLEFKSKAIVRRIETAEVEAADLVITLLRLINREWYHPAEKDS